MSAEFLAALPQAPAIDNVPVDPRLVAAIETIWKQSSAPERAALLGAVANLSLRWLRGAL